MVQLIDLLVYFLCEFLYINCHSWNCVSFFFLIVENRGSYCSGKYAEKSSQPRIAMQIRGLHESINLINY